MAEALLARPALAGLMRPGRSGVSDGPAGVVASERAMAGAAMVAGMGAARAGGVAAAMEGLGLKLPEAGRWTEGGGLEAVWLGPNRWLVFGAADVQRVLRERLGALAAVSDQSDARVVVRLSGARVRDALAKGVPIDLHPRAFGPNRVAATLAARIGILIWQRDPAPTFDLAVARSYAGSLAEWLIGTAAEYGLEVLPGSAGSR